MGLRSRASHFSVIIIIIIIIIIIYLFIYLFILNQWHTYAISLK